MRSLPTWRRTDPGGFEPGVNLFAVRGDIFVIQEAFKTPIKSPPSGQVEGTLLSAELSRPHNDNLKLSPAEAKVGATRDVSVDVENTGNRGGDAVVQLYIHQRAGSGSRPVRQLKGFQRLNLAAGAKQTLHFKLGPDELQFWSPASRKWVVEREQFDVWIGGDSTAKSHAEFRLTE
jgi:hypothetical protein